MNFKLTRMIEDAGGVEKVLASIAETNKMQLAKLQAVEENKKPLWQRELAKADGDIVTLSKRMNAAGDSFGYDEAQYTAAVALKALTDGVRFENLFATPDIVKAYRLVCENKHVQLLSRNDPDTYANMIAKAYPGTMSLKPGVRNGTDVVTPHITGSGPPYSDMLSGDESGDPIDLAYRQLYEMAEAARKKAPWLSIHQCFSRVMEDQSNGAVSQRATTSFPRVT